MTITCSLSKSDFYENHNSEFLRKIWTMKDDEIQNLDSVEVKFRFKSMIFKMLEYEPLLFFVMLFFALRFAFGSFLAMLVFSKFRFWTFDLVPVFQLIFDLIFLLWMLLLKDDPKQFRSEARISLILIFLNPKFFEYENFNKYHFFAKLRISIF